MDASHPHAVAFRSAVDAMDVEALRRTFAEAPELRDVIDAPWFAFDSPALVQVVGAGSRDMAAALLDLGADPDARSAWAAGPYSALHRIVDAEAPVDSGFADYLISRGATLDLHSAAGLGRLNEMKAILDAEPERVSEPGPDGPRRSTWPPTSRWRPFFWNVAPSWTSGAWTTGAPRPSGLHRDGKRSCGSS